MSIIAIAGLILKIIIALLILAAICGALTQFMEWFSDYLGDHKKLKNILGVIIKLLGYLLLFIVIVGIPVYVGIIL